MKISGTGQEKAALKYAGVTKDRCKVELVLLYYI